MSYERELLERVLTSELWSVKEELQAEIKELLSKPEQEQEQEPAAWVCEEATKFDKDGYFDAWETCFYLDKPDDDKSIKNVTPLYTSPPKREPKLKIKIPCGSVDYMFGFKDGFVFAEKAHGIGVDDE